MLELDQVAYHPAAAEAAILNGVSLQLAPGRPALVVGRSGSGKTTLLELIAGLASPDQGQISWQGSTNSSPTSLAWAVWCSTSSAISLV